MHSSILALSLTSMLFHARLFVLSWLVFSSSLISLLFEGFPVLCICPFLSVSLFLFHSEGFFSNDIHPILGFNRIRSFLQFFCFSGCSAPTWESRFSPPPPPSPLLILFLPAFQDLSTCFKFAKTSRFVPFLFLFRCSSVLLACLFSWISLF